MAETRNNTSIIDMAMGAIKERVDYEMTRVLQNIKDPNTKAAKKRSVVIQLDILPDDSREQLYVSAIAKSKLEPAHPIMTSLYLTEDEDGSPAVIENTPQIPGQTRISGGEQAEPAVFRILKQA